jgi:hypothetical protein
VGEERWIIVTDDRIPSAEVASVVAHEVAHAFLGHALADTHLTDEQIEDEVIARVREWGF